MQIGAASNRSLPSIFFFRFQVGGAEGSDKVLCRRRKGRKLPLLKEKKIQFSLSLAGYNELNCVCREDLEKEKGCCKNCRCLS